MMFCICGNVIDKEPNLKIVRRPCRCQIPHRPIPPASPEAHVPGPKDPARRRLGLPDQTDIERGVKARWV